MKKYTYSKDKKLKGRTTIKNLFEQGKWYSTGPMRMIVLPHAPPTEKQTLVAGVSVAKRNFKKAVDRNRIKRLLREAYRHLQYDVAKLLPNGGLLMFFWVGREKPTKMADVQQAMAELLHHYQKKTTHTL